MINKQSLRPDGLRKYIILSLIAIIFVVLLWWLYVGSTKPLPGEKQVDLGREHVEVGTSVEYNSNPPTSGSHYVEWTKPGVYTLPKDDRNLVHSLEHGYVIISYNCDVKEARVKGQESRKFSLIPQALAHGIEESNNEATTSAQEATGSSQLSSEFASDECHQLVDQLMKIYEQKNKEKLIIVPRPNLDARIALTAWNYIDKFNEFDEQRILKFIDAHRNHGPENTMEEAGS